MYILNKANGDNQDHLHVTKILLNEADHKYIEKSIRPILILNMLTI